jgi:predicted Zn-dependent protease
MGEDERAIFNYRKALDLVYKEHPDYDWVYANYAELMMKLGRYEEAFQFAAEAAARNPASARDCYLTGKALTKLGKWTLSVRWLKRAAELDSRCAEPHYLLAQAYRKQGAEADALRELDRFKTLAASEPRERR